MNEYLKNHLKEQRAKNIIDAGLIDVIKKVQKKVYMKDANSFPTNVEYFEDEGGKFFYEKSEVKVPAEITDEEYAQLMNAIEIQNEIENAKHIASIEKNISVSTKWITFIGIILLITTIFVFIGVVIVSNSLK